MKREVDLTPRSIFSNGFRLSGSTGDLFDPDHQVKLKKRSLPWEKTEKDEADRINVFHDAITYTHTWSTFTNNASIRIIDDLIEDFILVENDGELERISSRRNTTSPTRIRTSNSFNMINSWNTFDEINTISSDNWITTSQPAVFSHRGNTVYVTYSDDGNEIYYAMNNKWGSIPKDKNMLKAEDGDYFIIGKASNIRDKFKEIRNREFIYQEYQRLKSPRSKLSSYIFNKLSCYEVPDFSFELMSNRQKNRHGDSEYRWNVKPHNLLPISNLEYWEKKRDMTRGERPVKLKESFPRRYNCIDSEFICYDDNFDGIERTLFRISSDRRILLPEGVVKYKGHDFADLHRKQSWQPFGRVSQEWDDIFRERNDNWDLDLTPLIESLPASL